jgi:hypothetical protein
VDIEIESLLAICKLDCLQVLQKSLHYLVSHDYFHQFGVLVNLLLNVNRGAGALVDAPIPLIFHFLQVLSLEKVAQIKELDVVMPHALDLVQVSKEERISTRQLRHTTQQKRKFLLRTANCEDVQLGFVLSDIDFILSDVLHSP